MKTKIERAKRKIYGGILHFDQIIFYHTFIRWVKHWFSAYIVHIKFHQERPKRPVIIVSNHVSAWDPFLILSALPRDFFMLNIKWRFPAYHGFFKYPWYLHYHLFFRFIGAYPIKGEGDLKKSLKKTIEIIESNQNLIFFPEGKRMRTNEVKTPKKGIGHLPNYSKVYFLPVHVSYARLRKNKAGAKFGRSRIVIGNLIESEHFLENYNEENRHEAIMEEVYNLERTKAGKEVLTEGVATKKAEVV